MKTNLLIINIEVTDTFAGEANYSWVRRFQIANIDGESERATIRRAKAAAGLSGRHKKISNGGAFGDMIRLDFPGACICAFITWDYEHQ